MDPVLTSTLQEARAELSNLFINITKQWYTTSTLKHLDIQTDLPFFSSSTYKPLSIIFLVPSLTRRAPNTNSPDHPSHYNTRVSSRSLSLQLTLKMEQTTSSQSSSLAILSHTHWVNPAIQAM